MIKKTYLFFQFALMLVFVEAQVPEIGLTNGMTIQNSCNIKPGNYEISGNKADRFVGEINLLSVQPAIKITGNNITIDFQNAELSGSAAINRPDLFTGVAILITGKHVTLKNVKIKGYKIALLANGADGLALENCDVSYNYRPRLYSMREREDFSDWLSYHNNEKDEWLRYGAGIYLKNCPKAIVKNCKATGNQNALLLTSCHEGMFYNNYFSFNSGLGIGMYRCSNNKVMHNKLDWNVRGYSHGIYQRGQDSAGILVYEQCQNNLIAFNSATHSGDGFFLWAGQSTMESGQGGCNDNTVFGNDFSHAPTNGIEITFSRNSIRGNLIRECTYGIWGGYSYETVIIGNLIADCKTGIAIEHGQNNIVRQNLLHNDSTGLNFWARPTQPSDWGYAKNRDVSSRDGIIDRNVFIGVRRPIKISASQNMAINGENLFWNFDKILETPKPNEGLKFLRNEIYGTPEKIEKTWASAELQDSKTVNFSYIEDPKNPYAALDIPLTELNEPDSLPDGILAELPEGFPRGRQFIIMEAWGPFDFRRPTATLDTIAGNMYSVVLIGPSGDWKIKNMQGVKNISLTEGTVPALLTVERDPASDFVDIDFEYTSKSTITGVFGEKISPGQVYAFDFRRFEQKFDWNVNFYAFDERTDPLKNADAFALFKKQKPDFVQQTSDLWFAWWGKPAENLPEDQFATVSTAQMNMAPGKYTISITSDDGVRLYIDGNKHVDNWDIHEPETDIFEIDLNGKHRIEIEHFDAGGFATLDFKINKK